MEKNSNRKDIRSSADTRAQADEILSALQLPATDLDQLKAFPHDFSASGGGKGGGGSSASIEN